MSRLILAIKDAKRGAQHLDKFNIDDAITCFACCVSKIINQLEGDSINPLYSDMRGNVIIILSRSIMNYQLNIIERCDMSIKEDVLAIRQLANVGVEHLEHEERGSPCPDYEAALKSFNLAIEQIKFIQAHPRKPKKPVAVEPEKEPAKSGLNWAVLIPAGLVAAIVIASAVMGGWGNTAAPGAEIPVVHR